MDIIECKNKKPVKEKLKEYGFCEVDGNLEYSVDIVSGQLELKIILDGTGQLFSHISDTSFGDEYVLHKVPDAVGAFVGKVREEYERTVEDIFEKCFDGGVFFRGRLGNIRKYILEKYHDEFEFPWEDENAVVRRSDNKKWYAAFISVSARKLGVPSDFKVMVMNVKMKPCDIEKTIDNTSFFPAYHMNKKHWISVLVDSPAETKRIFEIIDDSYNLVK